MATSSRAANLWDASPRIMRFQTPALWFDTASSSLELGTASSTLSMSSPELAPSGGNSANVSVWVEDLED